MSAMKIAAGVLVAAVLAAGTFGILGLAQGWASGLEPLGVRDDDGDGVPNGIDPDHTRPLDCGGHAYRAGLNMDANGDGIPNGRDPDFARPLAGKGRMRGLGYRPASCPMFGY